MSELRRQTLSSYDVSTCPRLYDLALIPTAQPSLLGVVSSRPTCWYDAVGPFSPNPPPVTPTPPPILLHQHATSSCHVSMPGQRARSAGKPDFSGSIPCVHRLLTPQNLWRLTTLELQPVSFTVYTSLTLCPSPPIDPKIPRPYNPKP